MLAALVSLVCLWVKHESPGEEVAFRTRFPAPLPFSPWPKRPTGTSSVRPITVHVPRVYPSTVPHTPMYFVARWPHLLCNISSCRSFPWMQSFRTFMLDELTHITSTYVAIRYPDAHLLCIISSSRSLTLLTVYFRKPLGSVWRVFLLDP